MEAAPTSRELPRILPRFLREIAQLVRHEYNLGFVPPVHDAKPHLIDVRVTGPATANAPSTASDLPTAAAYRIDHRQAYIAPPPDHQ